MSTDITDFHIANIINKGISENTYSENAKTAHIRLIFKKGDKT